MRVADLCPECAVFYNASCILYNGDYLSTLGISPLDPLDEILVKINDIFTALSGEGAPTTVPAFIGQLYIDTDTNETWIGMGTSTVNWGLLGEISTTTTTTTSA